jgi:hypothetical protein
MKSGGGASAVRRAAEEAGLTTVYFARVESLMQIALRQRFRITGGIWRFLCGATHRLSLGWIDADATDYLCIFERRLDFDTLPLPARRDSLAS